MTTAFFGAPAPVHRKRVKELKWDNGGTGGGSLTAPDGHWVVDAEDHDAMVSWLKYEREVMKSQRDELDLALAAARGLQQGTAQLLAESERRYADGLDAWRKNNAHWMQLLREVSDCTMCRLEEQQHSNWIVVVPPDVVTRLKEATRE